MTEISKAYEPQAVEDKWYQYWLDQKCFVADPASTKPPYSVVIPPPNVTGMLHMGHVLNNTIQDVLCRKARMEGCEVLWLPGTDHAGIATQVMVEKQLKKEEKKSRHDIGREEFLKRVWDWKEKHGGIIINQLKKLGCSCDWSRERFTMDEDYSRCVQKVFVELYKKGLIYRGKRMVNWCPASLTALSDEEVDMQEQKGFLYYFKVEVAEEPGTFLTIATTRPETIPGDTGIAVNPKDPRYGHLVGKHAVRPLPSELPREEKLIPIVADEHIDIEFGTGVLKVTPAHDKTDFEIGQRHGLEPIEVIDAHGNMNERAGNDLNGMERFAARKRAAELLGELGLLEKEEPYTNKVGFSERAKVPIEPRLSEQWFLKYPSVGASTACVKNGEMKFHPDRWAKVYDHWMTNIQDWCISRQLWWGHRIPVWKAIYEKDAQRGLGNGILRTIVANELDAADSVEQLAGKEFSVDQDGGVDDDRIYYRGKWDADGTLSVEAATTSSVDANLLKEQGFTQDPDVLDTWFSSWLWPFATMGWPESTDTLKRFYPTTDLVTGPDIIFFWVARMIMAGYEFMEDLPFKNVYFTGIIRDKQGRKMSKTLGNSPDPLDLIAKYGADALRFGTLRSAPLGQDVRFDEKDVELGRNFCNKLWNSCRFRQMHGGEIEGELDRQVLNGDDKWILLRLDAAIREITIALNEYKFNEAAGVLYRFFWNEFCDWYLETTKAVLPRFSEIGQPAEGGDALQERRKNNTLAVLDFVLSNTLRLFHPFLPFITEELWNGMGYHRDLPEDQGGRTIMYANWPRPFDQDFREHYGLDDCYLEYAEAKYETIRRGRNLRSEFNIQSNRKVNFILKAKDAVLPHDAEVLKLLLNAEDLRIDSDYAQEKGVPMIATPLGELYLPLAGLIDVDAEKARLTKEVEKVEKEIQKVKAKLDNPSFAEKVPAEVLQDHQQRHEHWHERLGQLRTALDVLGSN